LRSILGVASELEIREPGVLRQLSLAAFDRTFAVTYGLQLAAIVIGLFGISVGTSAQALARRREFGVLYHLGVSRHGLSTMLAIEGAIVGALGAIAGYVVGGAMSLVLVHVVNRQSFHWSMEVHVPWLALVALGLTLSVCAALTAVASARRALGDDIVRAVKEDW
jgi:putative ABC transport system permease protein